jgi:hypothetical protein
MILITSLMMKTTHGRMRSLSPGDQTVVEVETMSTTERRMVTMVKSLWLREARVRVKEEQRMNHF